MHAPEVTCSVIAFVVPLASLACFAVGEKGLVGRSVDSDPDLARLPVDTIRMASQFMLTPEAVGIV